MQTNQFEVTVRCPVVTTTAVADYSYVVPLTLVGPTVFLTKSAYNNHISTIAACAATFVVKNAGGTAFVGSWITVSASGDVSVDKDQVDSKAVIIEITVNSIAVVTASFTVTGACAVITPHPQVNTKQCQNNPATSTMSAISLTYAPFLSHATPCPVSFQIYDVTNSANYAGAWLSVDTNGIISLDKDTVDSKTIKLVITNGPTTVETAVFTVTVSAGTKATFNTVTNTTTTVPDVLTWTMSNVL